MSEQVQSIVEAAFRLTAEQRKELMESSAAAGGPRPSVSTSRRELVESIKGKYGHVATSSESFMSRKREDLALECRP